MSPVNASASSSSSIPAEGAQAQGAAGPANLLDASTAATSEGQPDFSATLKMLLAGIVPTNPAEPNSTEVTPDVVPLPKSLTAQRGAVKTKTGDTAAINPAAAIAANLLPTPLPPIPLEGQPTPDTKSAIPDVISPGNSPIVPAPSGSLVTTLPHVAEGVESNPGGTPSVYGKQAVDAVPHLPTTAPSEANAVSIVPAPVVPTGPEIAAKVAVSEREPSGAKAIVAPANPNANAMAPPRSEPPAPTPPAPVANQIHDQIAGHLDQLQQQGRLELQLNLHPPELGRVQLHLTLEDGHLNVRMVVQDENAKRLIDQQSEPLRVRFAEMGVSVGQFDVRRDGSSPNPERQPAAEPSAQTLQPDSAATARLQKTYGHVAKTDAMVDLIA